MGGNGSDILIDERAVVDEEFVKRVVVLNVPRSEKYPEGIKYRMHYGTLDGVTILRYDNSHGTHERHTQDDVEEIEFPGVESLYRRFEAEIDS